MENACHPQAAAHGIRHLVDPGILNPMNAAVALSRLGGVATRAELTDAVGPAAVRKALRKGRIWRHARGTYAVAEVTEDRLAAGRLRGALALQSAALAHSWKVKDLPKKPVVCVPLGRNIDAARSRSVQVRRAPLSTAEKDAGVTSPLRTVIDCARFLPFDEGLAIADSALRARDIGYRELRDAAERSPRTGRAKVMKVAEFASHRAANPMESALRAICLDIAGLNVEPQVWVTDSERVDLADIERGLIIEAESYEFHGTLTGYRRDVGRYSRFVRDGWLVLRFTWEEIMLAPDYVRETVIAVMAFRAGRSDGRQVHSESA